MNEADGRSATRSSRAHSASGADELGPHLIVPQWPAPAQVRAVTTTRVGGVSVGAYASLNLGDHVADDPNCVASNRQRLVEQLGLTAEPAWLNQVHGTRIVKLDEIDEPTPAADGSWTASAHRVCAILTADCLPVLFCNRAGTMIGAVHAGVARISRPNSRHGDRGTAVPGIRATRMDRSGYRCRTLRSRLRGVRGIDHGRGTGPRL